LPSPRPRLRAAEDTFSLGKGGKQDTLSLGKVTSRTPFAREKVAWMTPLTATLPPARASSGLVVQPRQALGDPVAEPAELCWLLTAPDHS
jgi:hypothetical protein